MLALTLTLGICAAAAGPAPKNRPYDVRHYRIDLDLDEASGRFDATARIALTPSKSVTSLRFDCVGLHVRSATLVPSAVPLAFTLVADPARPSDGELTLALPATVKAGAEITLEIAYEGRASSEHQGLFRVKDPDDPGRGWIYATQFEALGARRFFPSNDEPYDRATTEILATVAPDVEVVSNGRRDSEESVTIDGVARKRVHWRQDKPHSTYLVALAVGRFARVDQPGSKLAYYLDPKKTDRAEFLRKSTEHAMRFFEPFLGVAYPWEGYAQIAVPTFEHGGMENTGATVEKSSAILPDDPASERIKPRTQSLVAHELAHQWFGNLVTLRWWDDLWLNESFASYLQLLASDDFFRNEGPAVTLLVRTHQGYFRQEGGPMAHPIVQNELPHPDDAFDATSYIKGENVLRMLDAFVGRDAFRAGVRDYLTKFALSNANTADFFAAIERASKKRLGGFQQAWLRRRGYPVLAATSGYDAKKGEVKLTLRQRPSAKDGTTFPFRMRVSLHRKSPPGFSQEAALDASGATASATVRVPAEPQWVTWNAAGIVLARIESRSDGEAGWVAQALRDPDPVARLQAMIELAGPVLDRTREAPGELTKAAAAALDDALRNDPSQFARAGLLDLFDSMPWKTLPRELAGAAAACAEPAPPQADPIAATALRAAAFSALGKFGGTEARATLARAIEDRDLPLDLLGPAASGMAALGDGLAVEALDTALALHGPRGHGYRLAITVALVRVPSETAVPRIRAAFESAGSDADRLARMFGSFSDNRVVLGSPAGAELIREMAVSWRQLGEGFQAKAVSLLEEATTEPARTALESIAKAGPTDRVRKLAERLLERNFKVAGAARR